MEDERTSESVGSAKGYFDVQAELPDWYICYLARLYEWEVNLMEGHGYG